MFEINTLTQSSMQKVEELLFETLQGTKEEESVNSMCMHVVRSGGKRLRPRLVILSALALNGDHADKDAVVRLAAAVELLHTASLIHDDVIDKASMRRGTQTLNDTSGNHAAVLAGDYMFTRCFVLLHGLNCMKLFDAMASAVSALVTGELEQLKRQGDLNLSVDDYCHTVYCKTGALFELACSGPAVFSGAENDHIKALSDYGKLLGQGFQIADDLLDYTGRTGTMGKTIGEDLADGRITLPLILAMKELHGKELSDFMDCIRLGDLENVQKNLNLTGALYKTQIFADRCADDAIKSLEILKPSCYRDALCEIARLAVRRKA